MAGLVIGGEGFFLFRHHHRTPFGPHQDLVLGVFELGHGDDPFADAGRVQGRLVDQVGEIGAGKSGRPASNDPGIHVGRQRHLAHVHLEDLLTAQDIRIRHRHLAIETARTQERRVEDVGSVGGGDENDPFCRFETVHLDQQLIQCLFALVVAAPQTGAPVAADGIQLVDEDDAGRVLLALVEHVADAAGTDTDEHLDEIRPRDGEERHVGLPGDGPGKQGLTGARRADEKTPFGDLAAQSLELLRVPEELDDLFKLLLRLVDSGDIVEGDAT